MASDREEDYGSSLHGVGGAAWAGYDAPIGDRSAALGVLVRATGMTTPWRSDGYVNSAGERASAYILSALLTMAVY